MIYVICASGLHRTIAKQIKRDTKERVFIVNIDKTKTLREKARCFSSGIKALLTCILDKKSHTIIPHPFNPWFSIFTLFSQKHSVIDDGIAYYYSAPIPRNIYCRIYAKISSNIIKNGGEIIRSGVSYAEYLSQCKLSSYYCFFPDLTKLHHPNIIRINIDQESINREPISGPAIFLDSSPIIAEKINHNMAMMVLRNASSSKNILVKSHPRHSSPIAKRIEQKSWVQLVDGDFEEILISQNISSVYSIYSSAIFTSHFLQPSTKLYCFTSSRLRKSLHELHPILERINVEFIECPPLE